MTVVFKPIGEVKKRLYTAVSVVFVAPLAIGAFIYIMVKTAPLILLGFAVIGVVWLLRWFRRRWQG